MSKDSNYCWTRLYKPIVLIQNLMSYIFCTQFYRRESFFFFFKKRFKLFLTNSTQVSPLVWCLFCGTHRNQIRSPRVPQLFLFPFRFLFSLDSQTEEYQISVAIVNEFMFLLHTTDNVLSRYDKSFKFPSLFNGKLILT